MSSKSVLILLHGDLGAGKTTLVSTIVKRYLPDAKPSSPTFNIINQYHDRVYHVDLYRIKDESELENIGLREILEGNNLVFIEWPCRASRIIASVSEAIPQIKVHHIYIEVISETERKYTLN